MKWQDDLNKSKKTFLELVWPIISHHFKNGKLIPIEASYQTCNNNGYDIAKDLDILCGIDFWHVVEGEGCRGIASRVQFQDENYKTFTIRKERLSGAVTEFEKREKAISTGLYIYPVFTAHAYANADGTEIMGGAVAKTEAIFKAIKDGKAFTRKTHNASFYCIKFENIPEDDIFIF